VNGYVEGAYFIDMFTIGVLEGQIFFLGGTEYGERDPLEKLEAMCMD
jgi:hypothetical protein